MSIHDGLERRPGAGRKKQLAAGNPMSLITRKDPWQEQLWNVSLLPAATLPPVGKPSADPAPDGRALRAPAVLSSLETLPTALPARAA